METFGSAQTPDLRLGELARIAMARPADAVRVEGNLYVDGGSIEPRPSTRLMLDKLAHVFAVDVSGDVDVRPSDRFTSIGPFDDRVSAGMDLYDLFIDRRQQPDLMLAGYRAARDALSPFTRRPAAHGGRRREATGS